LFDSGLTVDDVSLYSFNSNKITHCLISINRMHQLKLISCLWQQNKLQSGGKLLRNLPAFCVSCILLRFMFMNYPCQTTFHFTDSLLFNSYEKKIFCHYT